MNFIPIDIVNIILVYLSEINNDIIITQYHPITNKEYYKINFYSDLLWNIKSVIKMKQLYPLYIIFFCKKYDTDLYKYVKAYYEQQLREKIIK
jgi:hypothetical protein